MFPVRSHNSTVNWLNWWIHLQSIFTLCCILHELCAITINYQLRGINMLSFQRK